MLRQTLQQKQQLRLTPQQMLVQKLLALPVISLEQRIKEEIENNPALEEATENEPDNKEDSDIIESEVDGGSSDEFSNEDAIDFMEESDEYVPAYKTFSAVDTDFDRQENKPMAATVSLRDSLMFQIGVRNINEHQYMLADYIIGNIDDDGYLRRDLYSIANDISFLQNTNTDEKELHSILNIIQELDPAGIGARNLQECLILQLKRKEVKTDALDLALKIVTRTFDEFSKKNYEKIKEIFGINDAKLKTALAEIVKLNPKPGETYSEEGAAMTIVPDFSITTTTEGETLITLNSRISSRLKISSAYTEMSDKRTKKGKMEREAASFARHKMDSAKNFIDALKQRDETLLRVMQSIVLYQPDYFRDGDESRLKPMLLKNIATATGLDISTISRVVNSKYVQTDFDTFLLKNIFSESFRKESGEEVSVKNVKNLLREMIANEEKRNPMTDEALVDELKSKGYNIARRTVAKYREQLEIPVARLRKEI